MDPPVRKGVSGRVIRLKREGAAERPEPTHHNSKFINNVLAHSLSDCMTVVQHRRQYLASLEAHHNTIKPHLHVEKYAQPMTLSSCVPSDVWKMQDAHPEFEFIKNDCYSRKHQVKNAAGASRKKLQLKLEPDPNSENSENMKALKKFAGVLYVHDGSFSERDARGLLRYPKTEKQKALVAMSMVSMMP